MTSFNTFQNSLLQYAGYTGSTGGVIPIPQGGGGAGTTQISTTVSSPVSFEIFPIPPNTKFIYFSGINIGFSINTIALLQFGINNIFTTSGYSSFSGITEGFCLDINNNPIETGVASIILDTTTNLLIFNSLSFQSNPQPLQHIQLGYAPTQLRLISYGGQSLDTGTFVINFS